MSTVVIKDSRIVFFESVQNYLQTELKLFASLFRCAYCQVDDIFTEYESRIFGHQGMKGVDDQE